MASHGRESKSVRLSERDKALMTAMLDETLNFPALKAVEEGDFVRILNPAFSDASFEVAKVNKRRKTAVVIMEILDRRMECEVALEFVAPESLFHAT